MKIPKKDDSNHKAHYIDYNENFTLNKVRFFTDFNYSKFFFGIPRFSRLNGCRTRYRVLGQVFFLWKTYFNSFKRKSNMGFIKKFSILMKNKYLHQNINT